MSRSDYDKPPTWKEVKACCKTCPNSASDNLPYMAWWSYCQAHCKILRSCPDVKSNSD